MKWKCLAHGELDVFEYLEMLDYQKKAAGTECAYRSEAADGEIVAADRDFDAFHILRKRQLLNVLQPGGLGPVSSVQELDVTVQVFQILLYDGE